MPPDRKLMEAPNLTCYRLVFKDLKSKVRVITSWLSHRTTSLLYDPEHAADETMRLLGQCMLLVFSGNILSTLIVELIHKKP